MQMEERSLAEKMKAEKPRGEEDLQGSLLSRKREERRKAFSRKRRQNASERGKKLFMFLNEGQN